ncbi:riboflavin kinase [Trichomonascus vanleenenianus]|uniref:riboflavin kinase n=1 Tax=Trichomonascus vanleenenianus TaxID=2268995 RepID=UPI003EC9904B
MTLSSEPFDRNNRPLLVGEEKPEPPFPFRVDSTIISGFGRGSSDLGIPTANVPHDAFDCLQDFETGIYYGWAQVRANDEEQKAESGGREVDYSFGKNLGHGDCGVFPMVMSVGWNPFYHNKEKSAEIHIIRDFKKQFYGARMKLIVLGYIRPELDYISKEALIDDINMDIKVAVNCLERDGYKAYKTDEFFA